MSLFRRTLLATMSAAVLGGGLAATATAAPIATPVCPTSASSSMTAAQTVAALRSTCTQRQIDALYRSLPVGDAPQNSTAHEQMRLIGPAHPAVTDAVGVAFHGKHFYTSNVANIVGKNEVFTGVMSVGKSKFDGKPTNVIDYSAQGVPVTDEFRTLDNGVAVGFGYVGNQRAVSFWVWK